MSRQEDDFRSLSNALESIDQEDGPASLQQPPVVPKSRRDFRSLAFHYLYAIDRNEYQVSLSDMIEQFKHWFGVSDTADSFAQQLAAGVLERQDELDKHITPYLKNWKLSRLGCCTRIILRIGLWELKYGDAGPSVAINEAVELAKAFAEKDAYRFVNGLLDEARKALGITDVDKASKADSDSIEKDKSTT